MYIYPQNISLFDIKIEVEKRIEALNKIDFLYKKGIYSDDNTHLFFNEISKHEFPLLQNRLMKYIENNKTIYFDMGLHR